VRIYAWKLQVLKGDVRADSCEGSAPDGLPDAAQSGSELKSARGAKRRQCRDVGLLYKAPEVLAGSPCDAKVRPVSVPACMQASCPLAVVHCKYGNNSFRCLLWHKQPTRAGNVTFRSHRELLATEMRISHRWCCEKLLLFTTSPVARFV
jgi:hypothetical protein